MAIPFRVGETVHELGQFNDRSTEVARVRRAIRERERLLVYGERRMGKSSIVRRASDRERDERGAAILWLDLWSLTTVADVLRAVLRAVPVSWAPRERLLALLAGADVRPVLTTGNVPGEAGIGLGWSARELSDGRARELLGATLRALDGVAAGHPSPVAVAVDEFQQIESLTRGGGPFLRSVIQETSHLGWVLAGSMLSLIDDLTAPAGPFYNTPRLDVGPIEPDLMVPWIAEQMRANGVESTPGVGERVLEMAGPSTEARIRLARETFVLGMASGTADAATVSKAFQGLLESLASGYEATWIGLAEGQRRTLQILANGEPHPTGSDTLARYGVKTSSAVVRGVEALRQRGLLSIRDPARIADPFFEAWVRTRTAAPGTPRDREPQG